MRNTLIALVAVGLSIVSYLAYTNPALFQAAITGGADDTAVTTDLYVPADYKAAAGESDYIEVKAGKAMSKLEKLRVTLSAPTSQLTFASADTSQNILKNEACTTIKDLTQGEIVVDCGTLATKLDVQDNDVLFRVLVTLDSNLKDGNTVIVTMEKGTGDSIIKLEADTADRTPTYTDGKITIGAVATTPTLDCGSYGFKKDNACVCDPGYSGARCNVCDETAGYTGYPNCKKTDLSTIAGLVLTLNKQTISQLETAERTKAYSGAYLMLNSLFAVNVTLTIEGTDVIVPGPSLIGTPAEELNSISEALIVSIERISGVRAVMYPKIPGLIKLEAVSPNADMSLDGLSSSSGEIRIVPSVDYLIELGPNDSYGLRVVGVNADGTISELNFNNVKWQPQPVNRLNDAALKGGLLEKGDKSGITPLYAQVEKTAGATVDSNQLQVEVKSAPVIEYVRRIGTNLIQKGGQIGRAHV